VAIILTIIDLKENYCALAVAILTQATPEKAFDLMENLPSRTKTNSHSHITRDDVDDMRRLKSEGLTYSQIGEIYNLDRHNVYAKMNRQKAYK